MNETLHLETKPTDEELIARLADSLAPSWDSFVRILCEIEKLVHSSLVAQKR